MGEPSGVRRKGQIIRTLARCATGAAAVELGVCLYALIFLACLFQIPAAYVCARLNSRAALALVLATTVLQAALGIKMIGVCCALILFPRRSSTRSSPGAAGCTHSRQLIRRRQPSS